MLYALLSLSSAIAGAALASVWWWRKYDRMADIAGALLKERIEEAVESVTWVARGPGGKQ